MLTEAQLARNLKTHSISAADLATLESDFQTWLDGAGEASVVGIQFEQAASGDNRVYILYTE